MPQMSPRASGFQYGAPSPVNAGTMYTPPVLGTPRARNSVSSAVRTRCISSRSHWMRAPATNTLPSSAYCTCGASGGVAAMVVTRLFCDTGACSPVFMSRKQPVPYVFFAWPGSKQHWPNSADCWSPATPRMGMPAGMPG